MWRLTGFEKLFLTPEKTAIEDFFCLFVFCWRAPLVGQPGAIQSMF